MAKINEWGKGIGMFILLSVMFYFYWDNIFMNLLSWAGTDFMNTGLTTSVAILNVFAWGSFLILYITTCPLYLLYTTMVGSRNEVTTYPIEFFKAIGLWALSMPLLTIILALLYKLIDALTITTTGLMDSASVTWASNFSWMLTLILMIIIVIFPFKFILDGYGFKVLGEGNEQI